MDKKFTITLNLGYVEVPELPGLSNARTREAIIAGLPYATEQEVMDATLLWCRTACNNEPLYKNWEYSGKKVMSPSSVGYEFMICQVENILAAREKRLKDHFMPQYIAHNNGYEPNATYGIIFVE